MRVAILEDDVDQSDLLSAWLTECGHHCTVFNNGAVFLRVYAKDSYDMLILDWIVPETSGIDVLKHLRAHLDQSVPVIFITQRDQEENIVSALEMGADDYMTKPVSQSETIARVNAVARRVGIGGEEVDDVLELPPYSVNLKRRHILMDEEVVEMTQKEYELGLFLFKNIGRIVSRGHLLEVVWGTSANINTRTIDTHISRLRSKLRFNQDDSDWKLTSVYQHGYRLEFED